MRQRITPAGMFLLLWAAGCGSPTPPIEKGVPVPSESKPVQPAVSKPDKNGLVTMLQPVVKTLAADDPFRVALHFATEKGPLQYGTIPGGFRSYATVESMTFHVSTPQGQKLQRKVKPGPRDHNLSMDLAQRATFLLTLTEEEVRGIYEEKWAWAGEEKLDLTRPGEYTVRISGSIIREKGEPIPFASEPVTLQVSPERRSQANVETIARTALKKQVSQLDPKAIPFIRDDQDGNWLVSYQVEGALWKATNYTVVVKPDGSVAGISSQEVSTCIARGTLIATESGPRPVEDVRFGDQLWGYDTQSRKKVLTRVQFIRRAEATETLRFGETLRVTAEHPLWIGQWSPARLVGENDSLLDVQLQPVAAGKPQRLHERVTVYDLTVAEPHCFFAGGFLVHNKTRAFEPIDGIWYANWPEHLPSQKKE